MLKLVKNLIGLVEKKYYKKIILLQILMIVSSIFELIGFASIIPFIALVSNPDLVTEGGRFTEVYKISGFDNIEDFIFMVGVLVLLALTAGTALAILKLWLATYFANLVGFRIGDNLYRYYLNQDYEFHLANSGSYLTKQISVEAIRIKNIIKSLMNLNSDIFLIFFIVSAMLIYDIKTTITVTVMMFLVYAIYHNSAAGILVKNGLKISIASQARYRLLNNGFGGINEILMLNKGGYFYSEIKSTGDALVKTNTINQVLGNIPIHIFQLFLFGSMITAILYLLDIHNNDITKVIPILSAYAIAAYKLFPLIQKVYVSLAKIKSNIPALESIQSDIKNVGSISVFKDRKYDEELKKMSSEISLADISYTYPKQGKPVLNNISMTIGSGQRVGLVGGSGAGKTTLIKIIASILRPQKGHVLFGGNELNRKDLLSWKTKIGMVSQDVFLLDSSIAENIAFGIHLKDIDFKRIDECLNKTKLDDFMSTLPSGIYTEVGERGVQLSGGQKQRIALARALYHKADILILDEATSALDGITEKQVINEILKDKNYTVLMIAHRVHTLKNCDVIYVMNQGTIVDQGSYEQLSEKNKQFKKMGYVD